MRASTMIFECSVPMPQNGRKVAIVAAIFYDGNPGIQELTVEDADGERWNAYTNELRPA